MVDGLRSHIQKDIIKKHWIHCAFFKRNEVRKEQQNENDRT